MYNTVKTAWVAGLGLAIPRLLPRAAVGGGRVLGGAMGPAAPLAQLLEGLLAVYVQTSAEWLQRVGYVGRF